MDPGNWATDLAGGARYGYTLLSVILISNLMAILLQALAVRLGMPESTLRSHVTRLRARYREALHAEVRRTVETEAQAQEELHELLRVLTEN